MIDNPDSIFQPARQPEPPPPSAGAPLPAPPQRLPRRRSFILISIILAAGACLCLCGALFAGLFAYIWNENSDLETVIDQYMSAMAHQDAQAAYDLLSTHARQNVTLDDLKKELRNRRFIAYEGYMSTTIHTSDISYNSDRQESSPLEISVEGVILYEGGEEASFRASLEQENGVWKLYSIEALGSPGKSG